MTGWFFRFNVCLLAVFGARESHGAPFTPGNLAIYRIGQASDGTSVTENGEPVFVDEYTSGGAFVQSITLPTATSGSQRRLVASGGGAEGLLNRSPDGKWLTFLGYDAALGTTSLANRSPTTTPRVVARVDGYGNVDTSTTLTDLGVGNGNAPTSAATLDGQQFVVASNNSAVRKVSLGQSTSSLFGSAETPGLRHVDYFGGRLFASAASSLEADSAVAEVKVNLQNLLHLQGVPAPTLTETVAQFWMADLSPSVAGVDVLYVTEQRRLDGLGGIRKYSLVSGAWVDNGRIAPPSLPIISNLVGLTGVVSGTSVTLYGTRPGSLFSFTDATGHNGAVSGTAALLANAPANTVFRGVDFVPEPDGPMWTADFNRDGFVDGADLAKWKTDFGGAGSDANGDGISNGADFLAWQREYQGHAAAALVPEPTSAATGGLALAALAVATRRKRQRVGSAQPRSAK